MGMFTDILEGLSGTKKMSYGQSLYDPKEGKKWKEKGEKWRHKGETGEGRRRKGGGKEELGKNVEGVMCGGKGLKGLLYDASVRPTRSISPQRCIMRLN